VNKVGIKKIKFMNMEARRIGGAIRELRLRRDSSLEEFACMTDLPSDYLDRLEEGYEPEVERAVLERILEVGGVRCRYYTDEDIINIFLCISPRNPPEKLF
jgi:transcriptional regulator with XRE-family HTH domain